MFKDATTRQKRTDDDQGEIRCLGCGEVFFELENYQRHRYRSEHPDVGEVFR